LLNSGSCKYIYPVIYGNKYIVIVKTFWFTKVINGDDVDLKNNSDYSGRVEYSCIKTFCSLKIFNVRQTDSKEYRFRFITNQQGGKYTDLQVKTTVLSVTPSETVEGSKVTLTCSSDANPAAKYNIYRVNEDQHGQLVSTEIQPVFSSIQVSDSGRYYCAAGNDLGSRTSPSIDINVKYGPKNCSVSVKPSGAVEEGNPVTLTCTSDANPAANYTWYKENKIIANGSEVFHVLAVGSEHRGSYSCKAQNLHGECNSSSRFLDVLCKFSSFIFISGCISISFISGLWSQLQNHSFIECVLLIANNFHLLSISFAQQQVKLIVNQCCFLSGQFDFTEV
uniref:Ig-like domain-containing protein n=1 Tax=Xiphophorus maculatus TaxID=8083 RepID=A0A3B5PQX3_XIPMA